MNIVLKSLKYLSILAIALVLILFASWLLIPDEDLHPDAQKLLSRTAVPVSAQNGYVMLLGLRASPELDPYATGQKIVAEHEKRITEKGSLSDFKIDNYLGKTPLDIPAAVKRCDFEKQNCLKTYQGQRSQTEADLAKYAAYIKHYYAMRDAPQFSESVMTATFESPMPQYAQLVSLASLVDAQVALQMASPATHKEGLSLLAAEITGWKQIAKKSETLLSQMIAAAILQRKLRLSSEIMQDNPELAREHIDLMRKLTQPISLTDINIQRPFENEFALAGRTFKNLPRSAGLMAGGGDNEFPVKLLVAMGAYKPNATVNRSYALFSDEIALHAKGPKQALAGRQQVADKRSEFSMTSPSTVFYNPLGKLMFSVSMFDVSTYSFRIYDLVAYSRLLELQRRIAAHGIKDDQIAAFVAKQTELHDPYTEQPVQWNAQNKSLSTAGHGKKFLKDGRVSVELAKK